MLEYGADVHIQHDYALRHSAIRGHSSVVTKLLECGADVHANDDEALRCCASNGNGNGNGNLECGANMHARDDEALRHSASNNHLLIVNKLLENGANLYSNDASILTKLRNNFNDKLANVILPYCTSDDYHFFPDYYIREKVIPTKSANN